MLVIVVVVVVAVAGVTYVFVFTSPSSPGAKTTTSTLIVGTATSSVPTTTVTIGGSTTGTQSYEDFSGTFTYTVPLGPSGINDSTGKPIQWNSTQTATGSFSFSIDSSTYIGSGSGQGSVTVSTRGYCTGSNTVPYTFAIEAVNVPGTKNITIAFNNPTPSTVMVQLSCKGSTVGFYTSNNPVTYLSVYPNGLDLNSFPAKATAVLTGGISYTVSISET
jgi:hypothetical protein